jgi:hypothetical protein
VKIPFQRESCAECHRGTLLAKDSSLRRRDHRSDQFLIEVSMLGRRSHTRISIESGGEGVLSLTRDISVRIDNHGRLVAIGRDAGSVGERVRVVLPDQQLDVVLEVIESKPVVCDGAVRHQLLLRPIEGDGGVR